MRILITGNTSALSQRLLENLSLFNDVFLSGRDGKANIHLDFSQLNDFTTNLPDSIDVIIHCAASFKGNTIEEARENELINSLGTFKVMQISDKTSCKHIVYISTLSIYDHEENEYFGSYGLSKKHGQENLKYYCFNNNVDFTALLIPQIYDERLQFIKHQGMFYRIVDNARTGADINIYGSNDPVRNYLHVIDLVQIINLVIKMNIVGEYNCLSLESYKLSHVAKIALNVFKKGGNIKFLKDKPDIGNIYIPNDYKIYDLINYKPTIDLETGIQMLKNEYEKGEYKNV